MEQITMTRVEILMFRNALVFAIAIAIASVAHLLVTPAEAFRTKHVWCEITPVVREPFFRRHESVLLLSAQKENSEETVDETEESGTMMTNLMKDTKDLAVGDWVVAKRDVPSLGIRAGAAYKILSIFLKGAASASTSSAGLGVEVIPLETYGEDDERRTSSSTKYLRVYNPRDHDKKDLFETETKEQEKGVLVTPEEIGLVSVKADWTQALFLAVPGLFWVFVAMAFSNYYTDRYGGSFSDAFFRT